MTQTRVSGRPEHPSSPVLCQNLKRDRLLVHYTNFMNLLNLAGIAIPAGKAGGAVSAGKSKTSTSYTLFELEPSPKKPGLLRTGQNAEGAAIEVELWALHPDHRASFLDSQRV